MTNLHLLLHRVGTQAKKVEHFGEGLMAHLDVGGHGLPLGGEGEAAVLFVVDKAAGGQTTDHVGDGRFAQAQRVGNIGHAGIALAVHQFLNALQVVLRGFRPAAGGGRRCAMCSFH